MKCIICGNKKFKRILRADNWQLLKCRKCGLVVTKQEKGFDYKKYHRDEDYEKFKKHFRNIFLTRFGIVKRFKEEGRILDLGASTGEMLDIFKENGFETWGVEPSASAAIASKKGHRVIKNYFENAVLKKNYFDVVIMNHTLEHVGNPLVVMKKIRQLLKKDGIVLIDVPNFGGLSARILGEEWPFLVPEEHTFQFTKGSLVNLFEKAGFEVIYTKSRSGIFEFANPIAECLDALLTLKKRFFKNLLFVPYDILATSLDLGDSMTIVGKK